MNATKRLILIAWACFAMNGAFAGGTVFFINQPFLGSPDTLIRTNSIDGTGLTADGFNKFYYGLFIAPLGTTANDLLNPIWTFTGNYATNTGVGRLHGGMQAFVNGWEPGMTVSFKLAGWSANLGHDWSLIKSQLESGNWAQEGFFGQSDIGWGAAGGVLPGGVIRLPFPLFAPSQSSDGPLTSGFTLTAVPEPGLFSMSSLGWLLLYLFGFRKGSVRQSHGASNCA